MRYYGDIRSMCMLLWKHIYITIVTQYAHADVQTHTSPWRCSICMLHILQTHGDAVSCCINLCHHSDVRICLHIDMHILCDACVHKVGYVLIKSNSSLFLWI